MWGVGDLYSNPKNTDLGRALTLSGWRGQVIWSVWAPVSSSLQKRCLTRFSLMSLPQLVAQLCLQSMLLDVVHFFNPSSISILCYKRLNLDWGEERRKFVWEELTRVVHFKGQGTSLLWSHVEIIWENLKISPGKTDWWVDTSMNREQGLHGCKLHFNQQQVGVLISHRWHTVAGLEYLTESSRIDRTDWKPLWKVIQKVHQLSQEMTKQKALARNLKEPTSYFMKQITTIFSRATPRTQIYSTEDQSY